MAIQTREEELQEYIKKEEKEFKEQKEMMLVLLACPGWYTLMDIIDRHIKTTEQQVVYSTAEELENLRLSRERLAGVCEGLSLFTKFPKLIVDTVGEEYDPEN